MIDINDMPKLHSPFGRREINGEWIVIDEIEELWQDKYGNVLSKTQALQDKLDFDKLTKVGDYSWVFNDNSVLAVEKLQIGRAACRERV